VHDLHLTSDELLARWRQAVTKRTLEAWRQKGTGPRYVKLGKKVLYPVKAVEDYEQTQERGNTSA
jgi:hypothetical protein